MTEPRGDHEGMPPAETHDGRRHPRIPVELKVEYARTNAFLRDYTRNISKGGAFIQTERPLEVGTQFIFSLFIPTRIEPFTLRGEVAWVNTASSAERPDAGGPGMGIRFLYESDGDRQALERAVEDIMHGALGSVLSQRILDKG